MRTDGLLLGLGVVLGVALGGSFVWGKLPLPHAADDWVAIFTLTLTVSTILLWKSTESLAKEAKESADRLVTIETPYLTGGGDFVRRYSGSPELFRLDVENHGKTPAFMTAYDLRFAKSADLISDPTIKSVSPRYRHMDGISPTGARKNIFTQIPMEADADVVYGAVWYRDPILHKTYRSRFLLRIAPTRDIRGEGLTRLDVDERVNSEYWKWHEEE